VGSKRRSASRSPSQASNTSQFFDEEEGEAVRPGQRPDDVTGPGGEDGPGDGRRQGTVSNDADAAAGQARRPMQGVAAGQFGEVGTLVGELGEQFAGQPLRADDELAQPGAGVAVAVGVEMLGQQRLGDVPLELVEGQTAGGCPATATRRPR
jgi:hypothetical protein